MGSSLVTSVPRDGDAGSEEAMRVVLEACGASPCLPFSFAVNLKWLLKKKEMSI